MASEMEVDSVVAGDSSKPSVPLAREPTRSLGYELIVHQLTVSIDIEQVRGRRSVADDSSSIRGSLLSSIVSSIRSSAQALLTS